MSFLELHELRKVYAGGTEAVKGIDLSIERGEFVVLLGPSGCGKTTTLRMIAGLEIPTAGRIVLDGRDVTRLRPSARDVGFVFQFYALYPHLTVRQNIAFPLESVGMRRRQRRRQVEEVAARMGLTALLERHPRHLSGGDQQRVALARAMVRRPAVYLMDEPLGTLDADQRLGMREFIRGQQLEAQVATIYVTHDQEEAMALADRIVVMDGGLIRQVGTPMEVYDDPADLFVANFVGSPGMNFVAGQAVAAPGGGVRFRPDGLAAEIPLPRPVPPGPLTLGVRPEHVRADDNGPIAGTVAVDEYQGAFRIVHVDAGLAVPLVVRADARQRWRVGEPVRLAFDPGHTRCFHRQTRGRL